MDKLLVTKINTSSMQVLKTLQLLLDDNYTMKELVDRLNSNEKTQIFNNNVVSKYINTCRFLGIEILKISNKYIVSNLPFGFSLTNKDIEVLEKINLMAKQSLSINNNRIFDKFLSDLSKYSNKNISRVEVKNLDIIKQIFEKAVNEKRKVALILKSRFSIECIPIGIIKNKDKYSFQIIHELEEKTISIEKVSGVQILDKRFQDDDYKKMVVVFKLKNKLAKRYETRENETIIINNLPEFIVVENIGEPEEVLIKRLMRYDVDCEIISPRYYRNNIKNLLDNILENYGE